MRRLSPYLTLTEVELKSNRKLLAALSLVTTAALGLTACGGGGGDNGAAGGGDSSAVITTNGTEPQNPLIPTNTTEVGGGKIIDLVFSGLTSFDENGEVRMDQAESVEPNDDATVWTVKLKEDAKFTDGSPVTADSYINAWNYGADPANAQGGQYFFENIKGYSADKEGAELTGLEKKSDTEFTVTLNSPEADFAKRVGYSAFVPMTEEALKDTKKFGESPVGNGPYKLEAEDSWVHKQGIKLVKNKDYSGPREAKNGGVEIKFYESPKTAYSDVQSGNLDILDQVDPSNFQTYEGDFPETHVNQAAAIVQTMTIPTYLDHFKMDEEGKLRRQAISMALDRGQITDKIFQGTRTPAKDFTSPTLEGWDDWGQNIDGNEVTEFNAEKAKELWKKADEISKYDGTFTIAYNNDGGHEEWVTAAANSIAKTLDIKAEGKAYPSFAELLDDQEQDKMTGAFRSGWQADFPAQVNFLAPLYQSGAGSNYARYSSKEFDEALKAGSSEADADKATEKFAEAQGILMKDLPVVPLWYQNVNGVWSDQVQNVKFGWNSVPLYDQVTKG